MLEDLTYLVQLQEIDLRIREQEMAQEQYPAAVKELKAQIGEAASALDGVKEKLGKAGEDMKNWEEQVARAHEGLERSQERLNSIKTNREYDAVHAEIEAQKGIINSAEQRKAALSAEIGKIETAIEEKKSELDRITAENDPKIRELQRKIDAIDSTIASITLERDAVVPKIAKHVYRQYELIRSKRKSGRAISMIKSNRTCSICYKVLEPQLYNEIRRSTKMLLCQSCGSIMIWQPENGEA